MLNIIGSFSVHDEYDKIPATTLSRDRNNGAPSSALQMEPSSLEVCNTQIFSVFRGIAWDELYFNNIARQPTLVTVVTFEYLRNRCLHPTQKFKFFLLISNVKY